jgi:hypothetical protein
MISGSYDNPGRHRGCGVGGWGLTRAASRLGTALKTVKPIFLNEKLDFLAPKISNFYVTLK